MKNITASLMLLFTVTSFASGEYRAEFDQTQEVKCHEELKAQGCVRNGVENASCSESNKKQLSLNCQKIHEARKLNS